MQPRAMLSLALAASAVACADSEPAGLTTDLPTAEARKGPGATATYEVTFTNLTETGQPFTPPIAAIHRTNLSMFGVGSEASFEVQSIAENGNLAPMAGLLEGAAAAPSGHVSSFGILLPSDGPPPLMPGETRSIELTSERGASYLSFVSMLICTNDGFTGIDSMRLPQKLGETATAYAAAYDAGTEVNTEDFTDIVPPCQIFGGAASGDEGTGSTNPALAEGGVIHHHPGIDGDDDLVPEIHGWTNPVAMVTVTRVE